MFTYLIMGLPFVIIVLGIDLLLLKTKVIFSYQGWLVMGLMLVMTAVFDQLLTGLPIVHYNESHMLGIRIWHAPIEDFTYTFAAVIVLGSLWKYYEQRQA